MSTEKEHTGNLQSIDILLRSGIVYFYLIDQLHILSTLLEIKLISNNCFFD